MDRTKVHDVMRLNIITDKYITHNLLKQLVGEKVDNLK